MKTKYWILIFAGAALLCTAALLFPGGQASGSTRLGVFLDGALVREIDLAQAGEAYSFTVESEYGWNSVQVDGGSVWVRAASCPDGSCTRHAPLPGAATPIVCLPNRLVIRPLDGADPGYDAISGVAG